MHIDAAELARIRVWALLAALAVLALPAGPAGRRLRLGFSAALLLLLLYLHLVAHRRLKKRLVAQHLGDAGRAPTARPSLRMAAELPRRVATPAAPPLHVWGEPAASEFRLRGPSYLETGVKMPSSEAMFELVGMDLYACACHEDRLNLSGRRDHWLQQLAAASSRRSEWGSAWVSARDPARDSARSPSGNRSARVSSPRCQRDLAETIAAGEPFTLVLNVIVPAARNYSALSYFRVNSDVMRRRDDPAVALFLRWLVAPDAFRNERLKLVPRISGGSYVMQQGVGSKPVLLGKRIEVSYHPSASSFEVVINVCSNSTADMITRLVRDSMASSVALDLALTIEGRAADELPERIVCAVRFDHLDFDCATPLPPLGPLGGEAETKCRDV